MPALNCPLAELSAPLQARTLYHHTVFGLARYMSGQDRTSTRHPLDLAFLLGLSGKVKWYRKGDGSYEASNAAGRMLLTLLARHWTGQLADIDTHMLSSRLAQFPVITQTLLVADLERKLDRIYFLPKLERYIAMKEADFAKIPKEVYDRLEQHLGDLEAALLNKDPMMPQHLRSSHAILVTYPETVHLLDDSDVARLIDAAEIHTKTEIVKAVASGKGGGAGSKKKVSIADL